MHELKNQTNSSTEITLPFAQPAKGINPIKHISAKTEIEDTLYDFRELQFLADISGLNKEGMLKSWLSSGLEQEIALLKTKIKNRLHLLERAKRWSTGQELYETTQNARAEVKSIKDTLRNIYRHRGSLLCGSDWQSPIYESTSSNDKNRLNAGIAEHTLDYKRDGHLDAHAYEESFLSEYASHLGSSNLKAYLTNNGMAAFSTALHWLAHELKLGQSVLALLPMYFENIHLAQAVFPAIEQFAPTSSEQIIEKLDQIKPSIVFCDTVTNCTDVLKHQFESVVEWAKREHTQEIAIVIDTTCMPTLLLEDGLLENIPANVIVLIIESLAKYHQFGMDLVTGGIAILHANAELQTSFSKTRARMGTNIVDTNVGSLPDPNRLMLTTRLKRHSRNLRMLAETLERHAQYKQGIIESISWQEDVAANAPWYHSSCLTLKFRKAEASIAHYKEFESAVLLLAQKKKHAIAFSTSFGFDVTRMYVTAPASVFEPPFLRVAVGTESEKEIKSLISIIDECSMKMALKYKTVSTSPISTCKSESRAVLPYKNQAKSKPGLQNSVYLGDEALMNYLSPQNFAATPLVELPEDLNPFKKDGVRLLAKMVPLVPLMNIKSIPAFSMINKAARRGDLNEVETIIESSSSNTVLSLSVVAKLFGIDRTCAIVDHSIAPSLVRMLRLFGIEIFLHPSIGHELFGKIEPRSQRATNMGAQKGWFNPNQYANPDNPEGFARWLAPDLWAQTQGKLDILSCALGTCGTMVGLTRALREQNADMKIVACCPAPGQAVPGPREKVLLGDVAFPWQQLADARPELAAEESFAASIKLLRRGILGGPSSGMNYAGVLKYLQEEKDSGRLQAAVNEKGELWSVFLCCDSPLPHIDEYYDALGDEYFPIINPVPNIDP